MRRAGVPGEGDDLAGELVYFGDTLDRRLQRRQASLTVFVDVLRDDDAVIDNDTDYLNHHRQSDHIDIGAELWQHKYDTEECDGDAHGHPEGAAQVEKKSERQQHETEFDAGHGALAPESRGSGAG